MGKASRSKGARGEVELRALLASFAPVEKLSGMYVQGPDMRFLGYEVECKRYKEPISKKLNSLLEDVPIVMERADRGEWVVHLRLRDLLDLLGE